MSGVIHPVQLWKACLKDMIGAKACPTFLLLSAYVLNVLVHQVCSQQPMPNLVVWTTVAGGVPQGLVQEGVEVESTSKDEGDKEEKGLITQG